MNPMLAHVWKGQDLTGWLISEKLDGVRALWLPLGHGDEWVLTSRRGQRIHAPQWWLNAMPRVAMDGEIYDPNCSFDEISATCRRLEPTTHWSRLKLWVFDLPGERGGFIQRLETVAGYKGPAWELVEQTPVDSMATVESTLAAVLLSGGEGLIAKHPYAPYEEKRSKWMLKIKPEHHGEAKIVGFQDGRGKHLGKIGAYIVKDGAKTFEVGTGLTDLDRENPLEIGQMIRYSHFGSVGRGTPRHPVFRGALL